MTEQQTWERNIEEYKLSSKKRSHGRRMYTAWRTSSTWSCRTSDRKWTCAVTFCSPKRVALFQELQREEDVNLRKVCPTRWTLKAASLRSVLLNYESLITFLSAGDSI
ncbi:unnamed protein product [Ixodes pacificus]